MTKPCRNPPRNPLVAAVVSHSSIQRSMARDETPWDSGVAGARSCANAASATNGVIKMQIFARCFMSIQYQKRLCFVNAIDVTDSTHPTSCDDSFNRLKNARCVGCVPIPIQFLITCQVKTDIGLGIPMKAATAAAILPNVRIVGFPPGDRTRCRLGARMPVSCESR